jgi:hypothetical protein
MIEGQGRLTWERWRRRVRAFWDAAPGCGHDARWQRYTKDP